jgi:hypothetical protein
LNLYTKIVDQSGCYLSNPWADRFRTKFWSSWCQSNSHVFRNRIWKCEASFTGVTSTYSWNLHIGFRVHSGSESSRFCFKVTPVKPDKIYINE